MGGTEERRVTVATRARGMEKGESSRGCRMVAGDGNDDGERWREEGRGDRTRGVRGGRTASSKVGKKPRKGLCLVRGPAGGRKLRVFLCPPTWSRDRWSFPTRQYMSRGTRTRSRTARVVPSRRHRHRQSFHIHTKTRVPRWWHRGVWWPLGAGSAAAAAAPCVADQVRRVVGAPVRG